MKHPLRLLLCALTFSVLLGASAAPVLALQEQEHEAEAPADNWKPTIAKIVNFAILAGGVYYFARGMASSYLRDRAATIKKDLVDAKALRLDAEQRLTSVRQRLSQLPAELDQLKRRGEEELAAEKVRLAHATAAERQRVLEQTRREIDVQSRLARRELIQHGVELSMNLARKRIETSMTPDDQARLIDQYAERARTASAREVRQ